MVESVTHEQREKIKQQAKHSQLKCKIDYGSDYDTTINPVREILQGAMGHGGCDPIEALYQMSKLPSFLADEDKQVLFLAAAHDLVQQNSN